MAINAALLLLGVPTEHTGFLAAGNSPIVFTSSAAPSVNAGDTAVVTVATSGGTGDIDFSISGGADAGMFSIDAESGALAFRNASVAGVYTVIVTASSDWGSARQTITATVAAGGYTASAVHFPAGTYLARGGTLTGVADGPKGVIFYWFKAQPSPPASSFGRNIITSIPSYDIDPYDFEAAVVTAVGDGTNLLSGTPDGVPNVEDGDWYGIARSWDTSDPDSANWSAVTVIGEPGVAPTVYPVLGSGALKTGVGFNAKWNDTDFYVFGDGTETTFHEVAQMWATPGISKTAAELIAAFWGADNKPKDLGVNGELAFSGVTPAIYNDGNAAAFPSNKGSGGGFSVVGDPLTNASTSPSG